MAQHNPAADKNVLDVRRNRSASASAVRDFRTRQTSVGSGKFAYEFDLLQSFARNQLNISVLIPVFIICVAAISAQWHGWVPASIWAMFALICHVTLAVISKRFLTLNKGDVSLSRWRNVFMVAQGFVSLAWITYAISECTSCESVQYSVIQFSTLLIFQASMFMVSHAMIRGAILMVLPATFIIAGRFFLSYEPALMIMGATSLIASCFFMFIAHRFKESVVSMMEYETIRETLIVELETEKSISEQARSRAEEANLAKSRFLATMSHELRTPLNAILGFSEIMRGEMMGPMENPQYKEYVGDIHSSGSHLLKLINEILDISRIEAGRHDLKEEEIFLVSIVDEARHMMNIKAEQKGVTLTTLYEDNLPKAWVDERSIRQITLNLISNALKFTPTGGAITVKVGWTAKGGQYIAIKDTGPGIPDEEIPIVLSSFGQGSIAIQNAEPGTGLGLTIVQALLHMHQGRFDLRSKLREGTEAIAYIPQERIMSKSAQRASNANSPTTASQPVTASQNERFAKAG